MDREELEQILAELDDDTPHLYVQEEAGYIAGETRLDYREIYTFLFHKYLYDDINLQVRENAAIGKQIAYIARAGNLDEFDVQQMFYADMWYAASRGVIDVEYLEDNYPDLDDFLAKLLDE